MDLIRFGRGIRALRLRRAWRQVDLGGAAGVGRSVVARIESGQAGTVPVEKLERVANTLGARTDLRLLWNGEALDRLLDAAHASIVDAVAARLRRAGWEVAIEVTFWVRGERGSIDVFAWHAAARVVLVIEVKSIVPDVQAMLAGLDRKARLATDVARERGWDPIGVGRLLVIGESRTSRRRVEAHAATFESALPDRLAAVRAWIDRPSAVTGLRGLWFLPSAHRVSTRHRAPRSRHRS